MTEYALIAKPKDFQEIVSEGRSPVHVGCQTRLTKLADGRYSCQSCLKVGYLMQAK